MRHGFSEEEVKSIIQDELNKKPDLKYYINNPYIEELVSLIIDGVSKAIVSNCDKAVNSIVDDLKHSGWR